MNLRLQNLSIGYPNHTLVSKINATLMQGDICVILGKNGSGKTTLLKTILQFIPALEGNILLDENPSTQFSSNAFSKLISIVLSQRIPSLQMKVIDFILQGRYPYHQFQLRNTSYEKELVEETLAFLNITPMEHQWVGNLSDGNYQKIAIARAIVQDTPIIVLDEPLTHLDVSNQQIILDILSTLSKEKQKTILFTSHQWNLSLQIANRLWLIKNENFYEGNTEDLALQENIISYFAHEKYYFDYCFNRFRRKEENGTLKSIKVVQDQGDSDAVFWLNNALVKHHYHIEENADTTLTIVGKQFNVQRPSERFTTHSINELIQILES